MPTVPVRGVGEIGLITDRSPQDTPFTAWTDARNVRFSEGAVSRYSVFKKVNEAYTYSGKTAVGVFDSGGAGNEGYFTTVFSDGSMEEFHNGSAVAVTPVGILGTSNLQITTAYLGDVTYVNREADVPVYRRRPADGVFTQLPAWDVNDRCRSLRSFKDFLLAINVQKAADSYPGMVKWSDAAQNGVPPANWSVADPASLAGENVLNDLRGELVDGLTLGDTFIVYGDYQTYRIDYIGSPFVFRFSKLFEDQGMIAPNCCADVEGRHFVFGRSDIYVHDGVMKQSVANGFVLDTIFSEIDFENRGRCHVIHDKFSGEVLFCYPSVDDSSRWESASINGCNKAAVYNYKFNTWTFVDLPSVVGWTETSFSISQNWEDTLNWDTSTLTWNSGAGQKPRNLLVCGSGNPSISKAGRPYLLDSLGRGRLINEVDTEVLWDAYAEATYKDMDELQTELYGRKLVRHIVPQIRTFGETDAITLNMGQSPSVSTPIQWGTPKSMNPWIDYKYDTRINGRYLSMRIDIPAGVYAEFSGYDADVIQVSRR